MPKLTALKEFPGHSSGRGVQAKPSRFPELRRWRESREMKAARVCHAGKSGKEGRAAQRGNPRICREHRLEWLAGRSARVCDEIQQRLEKELFKNIKGIVPRAHSGPGLGLFSSATEEIRIIHGVLSKIL